MAATEDVPITQMLLFPVPPAVDLNDPSKPEGRAWHDVLSLIHNSPGHQRTYWGRRVETPESVQLHIVKSTLTDHKHFRSSTRFIESLKRVTKGPITTRHARVKEFSPECKSLGLGAPVTGTAIYCSVTPEWDAAWDLWVSIVQHVPGFMGIAGGYVIDPVDGHENCFVALVGWESVEVHEAYHHTKHFWDRRRILLDPAKDGYAYYGHIAFSDGASNKCSQENGNTGSKI